MYTNIYVWFQYNPIMHIYISIYICVCIKLKWKKSKNHAGAAATLEALEPSMRPKHDSTARKHSGGI